MPETAELLGGDGSLVAALCPDRWELTASVSAWMLFPFANSIDEIELDGAWHTTVTIDDAPDRIKLTVEGDATESTRWVATFRTTEVQI